MMQLIFPVLISTTSAIGLATLALRVFTGASFLSHGYPKLFGKNRAQNRGFMSQMGIPGGLFDAVGLLEFLGGIFLILGLLIPIASSLLAIEMLATTLLQISKLRKPPINSKYVGGYEIDTLLLASSVALFLLGAGLFSIDYLIGI